MKLFDSHSHIDDRIFEPDLDDVIRRADEAGVSRIMVVGIDKRSSIRAVALAERYPSLYASVGIHPHDVKYCNDLTLKLLRNYSKKPKVKAWGEIGLDFNRMYSEQVDQEKWFIRQLELATELKLPIIFHERDSNGRFLEILKHHMPERINGVVHCFSGNKYELHAYLDLGLHIGITGIITVNERGEYIRKLATDIPMDRILIETDAPYLTPAYERKKTRRNEPAFVISVLLKLCTVLKQNPVELAQQIWNNTCRLYRIDE